jgi:tRNA A-37 threonylcarbamoyl transferase component Bud32
MSVLHIDAAFLRHGQRHGLRTFRDFFTSIEGELVGAHPSRNVARVEPGGWCGFLIAWRDYLSSWWAGFGLVSKSQREWRVLHALRSRGIGCPQPLAVGEHHGRAFLLVRELPDAMDLHTYLASGYCDGPRAKGRLACALGRAVARLHAAGFTHPDLYSKHVFIGVPDQTVAFIDFQRTRQRPVVSWRSRWRDLAALDASLGDHLVSLRERLLFLATYLRHTEPPRPRRVLRQALCAIARRTQRLLGRRKIRDMRRANAASPPDGRMESFRVTLDTSAPKPWVRATPVDTSRPRRHPS